MNLRQCECFLTLVNKKSISKAADMLFISKQGLSKSIRGLEEELGADLFIRTKKGSTLSPMGEKLYPHIKSIYDSYSEINKILEDSPKDKLHILIAYGFFEYVSPQAFFDFMDLHHDIEFNYTCCVEKEMESKLLNEHYDLAISSSTTRLDQLEYFYLFTNYYCFIINRSNPLAQSNLIDIEALDGLTIGIAGPEHFSDYAWLKEVYERAGKTLRIFPCYETSSLLQFAEENYGVSFAVTTLYKVSPRPTLRHVLLRDYQSAAYDLNIIVPKENAICKSVSIFISYMQDYCNILLKHRPNFPLDN